MEQEDKLEYIKSKLNAYIINIHSFNELKSFLNNLNKQSLVAAVRGKVGKDIITCQHHIVKTQAKIDELIVWKNELDAL